MRITEEIRLELASKKALVKRPAKGFIKHDYLVPGGPYQEQWDWDSFFVGMALASEIGSEAIYLKNWALNYLEHVRAGGFTPGLLTPYGIDRRLKHIKPFLAQGTYFAGRFLQDFKWVRQHWQSLKESVEYRSKKYFDERTGLSCWHDSMESGADNNPAVLDFPNGSVVAADLNTFLYREYACLAKLANELGSRKEALYFASKARNIKTAILKYLWDNEDQVIYNLDRRTGKFIKKVSYSSLIPLWGKILSQNLGRQMIKKYVLNGEKLWAKHGVRTLSADDPQYNQRNILKPHSNWQGPVWPLVNYLSAHSLVNYGFKKEALMVATKTIKLCLADLKKSGGMHENYNAETGKPLAAPNFISWNLLVGNLVAEIKQGRNPFSI